MTGHLTSTPTVVAREEQPYVGIRRVVTMQTMAEIADAIPDVLRWLADRGVRPAGPPFLRYHVIDMEAAMDVEAGVPVDAVPPVDGEVTASTLPAGRYATVSAVGHPDRLVDVTADLVGWASEAGIVWDRQPGPDGERWGCRLESYPTDPAEEPDMDRWTVELAFRLAD
jgi:effector-binding domain-containing protein